MISKNRIKEIRSLGMKKFRDESKCFIAEGPKIVGELLSIFPCHYLAATHEWLQANGNLLTSVTTYDEVTADELCKASLQQTPQDILAIFQQPTQQVFTPQLAQANLCLALDGVQDPGNVGTILRLADWFGIETILCSPDTADVFSPKVVQASMGAIGRVNIFKVNLVSTLQSLSKDIPVYGTFLDGEDIYQKQLSPTGIIIMGNEGRGIRPETAILVNERLFIPNYPKGRPTSESLNVAIATAITCAEFRRK